MQNNKLLWVIVSVLAAVFLLGGALLLFWQDAPAEPAAESAAETTVSDIPQTETTAASVTTTVTATVTTTASATDTAAQTTTVTEVTAPPLSPEETLYAQYIDEMLIKRYGRSQTFAVGGVAAQTGIAAAFVRDFRGTGTPDLLVIRLDKVLDSSAAVPVFTWYALRDGAVRQLDEFECKMNWCEYAVRMSGDKLYVSGDYGGIGFEPQTWVFTELAIVMPPEGDMVLENMQQNEISRRPAALYPQDAALLLEMQLAEPDAAYPAARQYLLTEYSDLERLLPVQADENA